MKYELSLSDIEVFRRYQRNVSGKEYIKVTSIQMLSKGLSVEAVSDSLGIDTTTVYRYWGMLSCRQISLLRAELKRSVYTDSKSVVL